MTTADSHGGLDQMWELIDSASATSGSGRTPIAAAVADFSGTTAQSKAASPLVANDAPGPALAHDQATALYSFIQQVVRISTFVFLNVMGGRRRAFVYGCGHASKRHT